MPRFYRYGYQGPQYAGLWKHQVPMPQTQAPGLRYGLGADALSPKQRAASAQIKTTDLSSLSDKELDVLIQVYSVMSASLEAGAAAKAEVQSIVVLFKEEKARRSRNTMLWFGGAALGLYLLAR